MNFVFLFYEVEGTFVEKVTHYSMTEPVWPELHAVA